MGSIREGLVEAWGAEEKAAGRGNGMFRCFGSLLWAVFPKASKAKLPVPPLHSSRHPWARRGGWEAHLCSWLQEVAEEAQRQPASHSLAVSPGVKDTNGQGAVKYRELFLHDAA